MAGFFGDGSGPSSSQQYQYGYHGPDFVIVSEPLTGDNYSSWSREMRSALLDRNMFCMVDGSTPIPDGMGHDGWQYFKRVSDNGNVVSWLLQNISADIVRTIDRHSSAAQIWKDLKDRFRQPNGLGLFHLKKELMSVAQGELKVEAYYTRLKALWNEMNDERSLAECTCGAMGPLLEKELVMQFLIGLSDKFAVVRGMILLMEPLPPIDEVYSLVVKEESQINPLLVGSFSDQSGSAYGNAINQMKNPRFCTYCGIGDHNVQNCLRLHGRPHYPVCNYCRNSGHKVSNCYKLHGYPRCAHCGDWGHKAEKCFKMHGYPPGYGDKSNKP